MKAPEAIASLPVPAQYRPANLGLAQQFDLALAGTAGPNMIELWRWEMQPGEAFASPGHPATTFELLHVEAGALTLTLGETCRTVAAGESAVARTEIEHGYRNEGTAPLVFTMTVAELPS